MNRELRRKGLLQSGYLAELISVHRKSTKEEEKSSLFFVASLKNCARKKDLYEGTRLHGQIRKSGLLAKNTHLGSSLINMYAKCGALSEAQEVFHELPVRNVCTWNALLSGYAQKGLGKEVLDCFCQMQSEGLSPDAFTYACTLKACGISKQVDLGKQIHEEIASQGLLGKDVVLGNALVDMYAKCGVLTKAHEVLDGLPARDVVSWTALIAGYAQQGQSEKAMVCYDEMLREGLSPNAVTYACILKAYGVAKDLDKGKQIHEEITMQGLLGKNIVLGNTLVDMYTKCGVLTKAQEVLDELPVRNVVSWNALIAGYVQQEQSQKAMCCYSQMRHEGVFPNVITYACILKACGTAKEVDKGKRIHEEIASQGLVAKDVVLGNALVHMYAGCGSLTKAQEVLDGLPARDVIAWTALIVGYVHQEQTDKAIVCYEKMRCEGLCPNAVTYACVLKAFGISKEVEKGKQIHEEIASQSLLLKDVVLGNALVDMYAKCGALREAQEVLDKLPRRDVISWTSLIAGYTQQEQSEKAIYYYDEMRCDGLSPNAITYACTLKACAVAKDVETGKQIHEEIGSQGLLGKDVVLGNALVDMYANCGLLTEARQVLDELPVRDTGTWSALIAGYTQQGQGKEAIDSYEQMRHEGLSPNVITYTYILKACDLAKEVEKGKQVHEEVARQGLLGTDDVLGNALVEMYAKCGLLTKAQEVLDQLPVRDIVSWTALIAGYVQQGHSEKAIMCYDEMRREGISPNAMTYAFILKAYGIGKEVDKGKQIHNEIASQGLLGEHAVVGNALIDMYTKCGMLIEAREVLDELPTRDIFSWSVLMAGYAQEGRGKEAKDCFQRMQSEGFVPNTVSWTTLIGGYAQHGESEKALGYFCRMQEERIPPDATTLVCVLNACSHSGLVDEGQRFFENMEQEFGITPDIEHHACMVDLFGRAGCFDKAIAVITKLPPSNYLSVWSALMGACRKWGNVKLGRLAFEHALEINESDAAAYVCMENIYAAADMQAEAQDIESIRVRTAAWKLSEWNCLVDVETEDVYSLVVGDTQPAERRVVKLQDATFKTSQFLVYPSSTLRKKTLCYSTSV